jgi:hypothetical protein
MATQLLVTVSVLLLLSPGWRSVASEYAVLAAFEQSVQDYVAVQQRLARRTPPLRVTADPAQLRMAVDALGHAVQLERAGARSGDVFTLPVAQLFRRRILCALGSFDAAILIQEMEEDNDGDVPPLAVNEPFPWNAGNAMWPSMLAAMPQLPEGIEYRFVGADLVLVDVRADLVIDILKGALLWES